MRKLTGLEIKSKAAQTKKLIRHTCPSGNDGYGGGQKWRALPCTGSDSE
jgi:hypothetical protein